MASKLALLAKVANVKGMLIFYFFYNICLIFLYVVFILTYELVYTFKNPFVYGHGLHSKYAIHI